MISKILLCWWSLKMKVTLFLVIKTLNSVGNADLINKMKETWEIVFYFKDQRFV